MEVVKTLKQTLGSKVQNSVQLYDTVTLAAFKAFSEVLAQEVGGGDYNTVCVEVDLVGGEMNSVIFFASLHVFVFVSLMAQSSFCVTERK